MPRKKRAKYNSGQVVKRTVKRTVGDLDIHYDRTRYSADVPLGSGSRLGVQGQLAPTPTVKSVHASTKIGKNTEASGSYDIKSKQVTGQLRKELSPTSNVQLNYNRHGQGGISAMYYMNIPLKSF